MNTAQAERSFLEGVSPFISLLAFLGIPAAGGVALVMLLEVPRFIYGQANALLLAAEIGSVTAMILLLILLRACLALPSAPAGFYRNVLDFLAIRGWHPAVRAALAGLIVLPPAWYLHSESWRLAMLWKLGSRGLRSVDVQQGLDSLAVTIQLALMGGVPLLFALHMFTRWKPKNRLVPWLLLPVFFLGTALAIVIIVTMLHEPS
jgi:hypothetical protein